MRRISTGAVALSILISIGCISATPAHAADDPSLMPPGYVGGAASNVAPPAPAAPTPPPGPTCTNPSPTQGCEVFHGPIPVAPAPYVPPAAPAPVYPAPAAPAPVYAPAAAPVRRYAPPAASNGSQQGYIAPAAPSVVAGEMPSTSGEVSTLLPAIEQTEAAAANPPVEAPAVSQAVQKLKTALTYRLRYEAI